MSAPTTVSESEDRRPLATPLQVAEYLGVPLQTIYNWRYRGKGPPARKVGKHLRWRWDDVEEWVRSQ